MAFLGGYYFFSTVWVPRLLLTLKARHWVTMWAAPAVGVTSEVWPEIFLMFVQFGGLVLVVWTLGVSAPGTGALTLVHPPVRVAPSFTTPAAVAVAGWLTNRAGFFATRGAYLTRAVELVLTGSAPTIQVGKTWPRLRPALVSGLSTRPGPQ